MELNIFGKVNISFILLERTEKVPLSSIKKIVSEPIKGHEEYYIMVGVTSQFQWSWLVQLLFHC